MKIAGLALVAIFAMFASTAPAEGAITHPLLSAIMEARKSGRPLTAQERYQQEQALYQHLKSLSKEQVVAIQQKLPSSLMQKVVERLKVLKQIEKSGGPAHTAGPNTVTSGASSVRRSGSGPNSLGGKGSSQGTSSSRGSGGSSRAAIMARMMATARRMMAQRRRKMNRNPIVGFTSFRQDSRGAMAAGCSYPIAGESLMETFFAGSGGCRMSAAVCYMKGMSCVDIGMSMMCCPLGYSSGTLRMMERMKQMQGLINSMS